MPLKRNTVQRQAIFDAVRELDIHATAEQVYEHVARTHRAISKATVYRNLSQMAEAGELMNIGSFYGSVHYDHNCLKHYHFICEQCKRVYDVNAYFPDIADGILGMEGFEITTHFLTLSGLCRACKTGKRGKLIP